MKSYGNGGSHHRVAVHLLLQTDKELFASVCVAGHPQADQVDGIGDASGEVLQRLIQAASIQRLVGPEQSAIVQWGIVP